MQGYQVVLLIIMVLVILAVVAGVIWLVRFLQRRDGASSSVDASNPDNRSHP